MDSYCPIVEPISGKCVGHLAVLLALGTPDQVSHHYDRLSPTIHSLVTTKVCYLLREHASGGYPLRPVPQKLEGLQPQGKGGVGGRSEEVAGGGSSVSHHEFTVCVEGIRGLEVAASTVWGEADCFIQYHFPTLVQDSDSAQNGVSIACVVCLLSDGTCPPLHAELCLCPYRTATSLYMPNLSLSHATSHQISLPRQQPIGQALATACRQGMSGHIPFELWRRFYYPNIRDQLLAKVGGL